MVTVVECESVPLAPAMVTVYVPAGVELEVVMLKVDEPEPVIEAGLNVALAPAGSPLTLRPTVPAKQVVALTLVV